MDCKDLKLYGSAYIDNMLSKEEELDFKSHINTCVACSIAFENLKIIVETTNTLEEVELPVNFSSELHAKLKKAKNHKRKTALFNKNKTLGSIVAGLLILVVSLSLINNFLNYNKGNDLHVEIGDTAKQEENIRFNTTSDESNYGTFDDTENDTENDTEKELIMGAREIPVEEMDEKAQKEVQQEEVQEDTKGNINKIAIPFVILTLIAGVGFFIYKVLKK